MNRIFSAATAGLALLGLSTVADFTGDARRAPAPRVVIIVVDGLRPDLITPAHTPALAALRARGVTYTNTHSSFPTVTRVNAAVLTTGMFPAHTGIVGNTLYDAAVDSAASISTGDDRALARIAAHYGRLIAVPTLGERLQAANLRYAVVTSSSAGGTLILNPQASKGVGVTINPLLDGGTRMSYTDSIGRAITAKFGAPPSDAEMTKSAGHHGPLVAWVDRVLRQYVLPELRPDVVTYWITEPDHTQHTYGAGSPQGLAALAAADSAIGRLVTALDAAGRTTNIIVVSDHGFINHSDAVPVSGALVAAGLKRDRASTDLVVVGDEHIAHIFVKGHDPSAARAVARFLEAQPYTAAVFARDSTIPGTFPLAAVHADNPTRGADLVELLGWRPDTNAFGVPGRQMSVAGGTGTDVRPITTGASGHGGLSPFAVHSTMILAGPAFQRGVSIATPSGNVDVMPTVLWLLGVPASGLDGRVLREALAGGPRQESVTATTKLLKARDGSFESSLQITSVDAETYVDAAWRGATPPGLATSAGAQGASDSTAALLVDLIRANSSNPPGLTRKLADALAPRFRARGIDVKIIPTPDTGKVVVVARLKGDGSKKPVLIAAHADVVGVEPEKWTVDPFAGVIKDDHVYGRGAIDFKGGMAVFARAVMMLAERKVPLARDVIFVAETDEEGALPYNTGWLARDHWSDIDAEFALNEGGWIMKGDDGGVRYVSISTADKLSIPLTITARGTSTHSSMPRPDNAIFTLSRAMAKISMYETPLAITPATRQFFTALSRTSAPPMSDYFRDVVGSDAGRARRADSVVSRDPLYHSLIRNTIAPVIINGGFRANVIPGSAQANINLRIIPGSNPQALVAELRRVIGDSTVELSIGSRVYEATAASSEDTDLYRALVRSAKAQWPRAEVTPYLFQAGTDAGAWRSRGVPVYGIYPYPIDADELTRMHGNDEKVSIESLKQGTEMIFRTLVDVAGKR